MRLLPFFRDGGRWIGGGFLLFFFSSFGQTFFISLSAGDIRREYGLSHGAFGTLYMAATLFSALTLSRVGQLVDRHRAARITLTVVPMLALAAILMALSRHVALLFIAIYLLRLFGQGMMSHTAFTALGRWFSSQRGRALSLATLGMNAGEALFPLWFVTTAAWIGWRGTWWAAAAVLVFVALPVVYSLFAREREEPTSAPGARIAYVRDWTRQEVIRDPVFYLIVLAVMPPALIGNTIFFHQVYLAQLRGWSMEVLASSFSMMAGMTVIFTLLSGQFVDRRSARSLLPLYAVPMGIACLVLAIVQAQWSAFVFMALYGVSNGCSLTLFGALWPETYGLKHLGAIRAVLIAILVFGSAVGPGLSGLLIDHGVSYPVLIAMLGLYCLVISAMMMRVADALRARSIHCAATSPA